MSSAICFLDLTSSEIDLLEDEEEEVEEEEVEEEEVDKVLEGSSVDAGVEDEGEWILFRNLLRLRN